MRFLCHSLVFVLIIMGLGAPAQTALSQDTCDEPPGFGYTRSISGVVDGDPLTLTVSDRFGGAVESVTWRGKEFINIWDHGRQISYAWGIGGYGECLNPTEPGSANDYKNLTSTSELLAVCKPSESELTTTTRPAYWLAPGQTGFCAPNAETALNETLVSDQLLEKTIQIGYEGIDNVIVFTATITNPQDYSSMRAEVPTGYLTYEFDTYYLYNPQTQALTTPESASPLNEPWEFEHYGSTPPILATADGAYAMGAYFEGGIYGIFLSESPTPDDETNKWNMIVEEDPYPAGTYTYRTFVIVGTLESVQEAMIALYDLHPADFTPPTGYVDITSCTELAGWAWDPGLPNEPIEVAIVDVQPDGTEVPITTVRADVFRTDLGTALGDNGRHGYILPTPLELRDGERHIIRAYALNPDPRLPDVPLLAGDVPLECPAVQQATNTPRPTATTEPSPTPAPAPGQPGCPLALMLLVAAVGMTASRRKRGGLSSPFS